MTSRVKKYVTAARQEDFCQRVYAVLMEHALAVISESSDVENHRSRVAFAREVMMGNCDLNHLTFAIICSSEEIRTALDEGDDILTPDEASDDLLRQTVQNNWNVLSGTS